MSSPNEAESSTSGQSQNSQPTPAQPDVKAAQSGDASRTDGQQEPVSVFASVHAVIANIREDARAKARQMIAEAEHALLESLRTLHLAEKSSASGKDEDSTSEQRGQP